MCWWRWWSIVAGWNHQIKSRDPWNATQSDAFVQLRWDHTKSVFAGGATVCLRNSSIGLAAGTRFIPWGVTGDVCAFVKMSCSLNGVPPVLLSILRACKIKYIYIYPLRLQTRRISRVAWKTRGFPGKTRGFQKVGVLHCFAKVFYPPAHSMLAYRLLCEHAFSDDPNVWAWVSEGPMPYETPTRWPIS